MQRSLIVLLGVLAAAAAIFAASFLLSQRISIAQMTNPADDLDWLRHEFNLNDMELSRIRKLHEGYLPKCGEMCERIAAKRLELKQSLTPGSTLTGDLEKKLFELGQLRAECQLHMLRHFAEVSQAMPPQQGQRYLAEMQRLTLGFHEQIEQSMSGHSGHAHGHH